MSIDIKHLSKSYGHQLVLDDISFSIKKGEIVGFLGKNGAGKSTTMKIITGSRKFESGSVVVCGHDIVAEPMEARRCIGYLPEHNPIYPDMYVKEYLRFISDLYKMDNSRQRVESMIDRTGLRRECHKKIGMLSKGYRQRVGLAQALIHEPEVLILDEPTTGLDPSQIVEVRDLIKEVGQEKTVMLSTHIMQEVSAICTRVIMLNNGRIVADDSEQNIVSLSNNNTIIFAVEFGQPVSTDALAAIPGVVCVKMANQTCLLEATEDISDKIFNFAVQNGNSLKSMAKQERSMEDVFRSLTH